MSYRIEYSPVAVRDMDRVWDEVYEASKEVEVATRYIDDLMDQIEEKREFPRSGTPLYYDERFTGYYFVVFKAYIAFYPVKEDRMLVDRVLYGKSDYMRTLFRKESWF